MDEKSKRARARKLWRFLIKQLIENVDIMLKRGYKIFYCSIFRFIKAAYLRHLQRLVL